MNTQLKDAIIKHIQANAKDFQLVNNTIGHFRQYIYDSEGEYFAYGGQEIVNFINDFINLYTK